jgi:predicted esterase
MTNTIDRRAFLVSLAGSAAAIATGCVPSLSGPDSATADRITAHIAPPTGTPATGLSPLGLATGRDGLLYVPTSYTPSEPLPLVVLLHGAGGSSANWFGSYAARGESARFILLAIDSRGGTWDLVNGAYGADLRFLDRAMQATFDTCAVRPGRITLMGFSDGASYALALGLANGDVFDHVVAYSPGFLVQSHLRGKPKFFIAHGTQDTVLPIDATSRLIVPQLRGAGYSVDYTEFVGVHEVPSAISTAAFGWLANDYSEK